MVVQTEIRQGFMTPDEKFFETKEEALKHHQNVVLQERIKEWSQEVQKDHRDKHGGNDYGMAKTIYENWRSLLDILQEGEKNLGPGEPTDTEIHAVLNTPITDLGVQTRFVNILQGSGYLFAGDFIVAGEKKVKDTYRFGEAGFAELTQRLRLIGITWGMDLRGWERIEPEPAKTLKEMVQTLAVSKQQREEVSEGGLIGIFEDEAEGETVDESGDVETTSSPSVDKEG